MPSARDAVDTILGRLGCELNLDPQDQREDQLRGLLTDLADRFEAFGVPRLADLAATVRQACSWAVLPDLPALVVELDQQWSAWKEQQPDTVAPEAAEGEADPGGSAAPEPPAGLASAWTLDEEAGTADTPDADTVSAEAEAGAATVEPAVEGPVASAPAPEGAEHGGAPCECEAEPVVNEGDTAAEAEAVPAAEPAAEGIVDVQPCAEAEPAAAAGCAPEVEPAAGIGEAVGTEAAAADESGEVEPGEPVAEPVAHIETAAGPEAATEPALEPSEAAEAAATTPVPTLAVAAVPTAPAAGIVIEDTVADDVVALLADRELADMFIAEALDHLSSIEATVLALEATPNDSKLLNDVFRPFHTVKGNAGALGVRSVQEFSHKVENLLDLARSGQHDVGPREIEVVLKSVDLLTAMLQDLTKRMGGDPGLDLLPQRAVLTRMLQNLISGTAEAPADEAAPAAEPSAAPSPAPEPEAVAPAPPERAAVPQPAAPAAAVAAPVTAAPAVTPVVAPPPAVAAAAPPEPEGPPRPSPAPAAAARDTSPMAAVKVDTRKLDNLVDMVGELVIVQSLIQQDPVLLKAIDERLGRNLSQLRRITGDLQRSAMAMRMVPIRQTFQKMARLVRDMSKSTGKQVELQLSGEDTELDRKMVEDIGDPLVHMVRNSLDHGLEDPETRARLGKRPVGKLALSAYHQGGSIVIAISDDGAGLKAEKILAKAIQKGLVAPGTSLSQSEIHGLIFQPGFSTADRVTEISGRGVGLDVVRRNIEQLRGRIEIHSTPGQGTTFLLKLPLTLAIIDGLLVRVGQQRFVVPTFCVRESLRPHAEHVHSVKGRPRMVQVRDSLVPIVYLAELFDVTDAETDPCRATVVVIEDDGRQVGLVVDQLLGKQEAVIKSLGEVFSTVRGIAGGAILGDGRVGLIVDAAGILALSGVGSQAA